MGKPVAMSYGFEMALKILNSRTRWRLGSSLGQLLDRWLGHWLGPDVDAALIDGRKTLWHRLAFGGVSAIVIATNLGPGVGVAWLVVSYGGETLGWITSRKLAIGRSGTIGERLAGLGAILLMTLNWAMVPLVYWHTGRPGLQAVAIVIASALLIHAQAFTFRSRAVLLINGGIPAATLVMLVLVFTKMSGPEWITAAFGVGTALSYVVLSAHANRVAAKRLDDSRDELERIAYSDALTTLANRRRFTEDMRQLMAYSQRNRTRFALVLIDLDRFKDINDRLGHDAGDALLVAAAARLRTIAGGADRIARLGGDEFALLVADVADHQRVAALCKDILDGMSATLEFNGSTLKSTSSIGVAIYPQDGAEENDLYKAADIALYAAKNGGRNTWRAFEGAAA